MRLADILRSLTCRVLSFDRNNKDWKRQSQSTLNTQSNVFKDIRKTVQNKSKAAGGGVSVGVGVHLFTCLADDASFDPDASCSLVLVHSLLNTTMVSGYDLFVDAETQYSRGNVDKCFELYQRAIKKITKDEIVTAQMRTASMIPASMRDVPRETLGMAWRNFVGFFKDPQLHKTKGMPLRHSV